MKPTPCFAAAAATEASVCSSASEALALQVRIVAAEASRQSTGLRCWCGESPITIVVAEKRFTCPISADDRPHRGRRVRVVGPARRERA